MKILWFTIITNKKLDGKLKEEYERGISVRQYVDGIKRGTILDPDKVLEEIQKGKVNY